MDVGRLLSKQSCRDILLGLGLLLSLIHISCSEADDLPKPNFDLICVMHLPWVLDEPVDGPNSPNAKET